MATRLLAAIAIRFHCLRFFFAPLRETFFFAESGDLILVRLRLTAKRNGRPNARCYRNPVQLFAFFFAPLHLCVRLSSLLRVAI